MKDKQLESMSLHPGSLWHAKPGQLLDTELHEVKIEGREPSAAHEWVQVEQRLVLCACVARLYKEWTFLSTLVTSVPPLPPNTYACLDARTTPL